MEGKETMRLALALVYAKAARHSEAVRLLEAINMASLTPQARFEAQVTLGKCWMHVNRREEAKSILESAIRDYSEAQAKADAAELAYYEACVTLAVLFLLNQQAEGMRYYRKALDCQSNSQLKVLNLGRIASKYMNRSAVRAMLLFVLEIPLNPILLEANFDHSPSEIAVICVKVGEKYGPEYVNKLYNGVSRHFKATPFTFICLTDDPSGLLSSISIENIDSSLPLWWSKVRLFERNRGQMSIYLDLDIVITGDISPLASYTGSFMLVGSEDISCEDCKDGYNSSIMIWRSEHYSRIYSDFIGNQEKILELIDRFDHWLQLILPKVDLIQEEFPGICRDFNASCKLRLPEGCGVVIFPQSPKPLEYPADWVCQHWV